MIGMKKYRIVGLLLILGVVAGMFTESYAQVMRRVRLPLIMNNAPAPAFTSDDLRVDNIPTPQLNNYLLANGITNPSTRATIVQWIVNDRNGGGNQPDGYPAPATDPDAIFAFQSQIPCQLGQGCFVGWKTSGHAQSAFRTPFNDFDNWSVGVICPILLICTIISRHGPTNNTPQPRQIVEYRLRANGAPIRWIQHMCSF